MTMVATLEAPITAEDLKKAFEKADFIEIPASIHDYWQLIDLPQYRLDYINHQIKGTMSYGSLPHETIISNLIIQMGLAFEDNGYQIFGSNRPLFAEGCNEIFEADIHMALQPIQLYEYDKTKTATKNPCVVVEVHSPSTRNYDLSEKLECYKAILSVQQIIYIETATLKVTTYNRTNKPNRWLSIDYKNELLKVKILNKFIALGKIYKNTSLI
jgi:Uma2 family endonuclease